MYSLKRHTIETVLNAFGVALFYSSLLLDITNGRTAWATVDGALLALCTVFLIGDIIRGVRGRVQVTK